MEDHFSQKGAIKLVDCRVMGNYAVRLRLSQSALTAQFVEFAELRDAEDAVRDLNGREFMNERITVEFARAPRQFDGPRPPYVARRGRRGLTMQPARTASRWNAPAHHHRLRTRHQLAGASTDSLLWSRLVGPGRRSPFRVGLDLPWPRGRPRPARGVICRTMWAPVRPLGLDWVAWPQAPGDGRVSAWPL